MAIKKTTDLKSVSLEQIKNLEGATVVGGGGGVVSASKAEKSVRKLEKTLEKLDKNPTPEGGSSTGGDNKDWIKAQDEREADGLPPWTPPKP